MSESSIPIEGAENKDLHPLSVGEQLQRARVAKGLSVADAAEALKLSRMQVEALETDHWSVLPGATFVHGFVRNYARLLGLDAGHLMDQLKEKVHLQRQALVLPESTRVEMPDPAGHARSRDYLLATSGVFLVLAALLVYFLMPSDISRLQTGLYSVITSISSTFKPIETLPPETSSETNAPIAVEAVLPPGSTVNMVLSPETSESPSADTAGESAAQILPILPQPGPATLVAPASEVKTPSSQAPLRLSFEQESWVEVRDRRNNVIYSENAAPGTERAIEGEGPFSLVFGNAKAVKVWYRGKPVDLVPYVRGDVARVTLE